MSAEERPLPDLKARKRLARAAPDSEGSSLEEPAEGKVRETVLVKEAFSVTMVRPEGRVVREETLPFLGPGEVEGILEFRVVIRTPTSETFVKRGWKMMQ